MFGTRVIWSQVWALRGDLVWVLMVVQGFSLSVCRRYAVFGAQLNNTTVWTPLGQYPKSLLIFWIKRFRGWGVMTPFTPYSAFFKILTYRGLVSEKYRRLWVWMIWQCFLMFFCKWGDSIFPIITTFVVIRNSELFDTLNLKLKKLKKRPNSISIRSISWR